MGVCPTTRADIVLASDNVWYGRLKLLFSIFSIVCKLCKSVIIGCNILYYAENCITECGSKLIYELLPAKEVDFDVQITSILGKLPVVRAGPFPSSTAQRLGLASIVSIHSLLGRTAG